MNPYVLEIFARMRQAELLEAAERHRRVARKSVADMPMQGRLSYPRGSEQRRKRRAGLSEAFSGRAAKARFVRLLAGLFAGRKPAARREVAGSPRPA